MIFDEAGHGVVLLYNRTMRSLFGLVFQRTPVPPALRISPPQRVVSAINPQAQQLLQNLSASLNAGIHPDLVDGGGMYGRPPYGT